jgi:hypothetical protein
MSESQSEEARRQRNWWYFDYVVTPIFATLASLGLIGYLYTWANLADKLPYWMPRYHP